MNSLLVQVRLENHSNIIGWSCNHQRRKNMLCRYVFVTLAQNVACEMQHGKLPLKSVQKNMLISLVNIFDQCASRTCIIHCFPSSCGCSFSGILICHVGTISNLLSQLVEQAVISAAVHIFGIHFQCFFLLQLCLKVAGTGLLFEKLHMNEETENARTLCCL